MIKVAWGAFDSFYAKSLHRWIERYGASAIGYLNYLELFLMYIFILRFEVQNKKLESSPKFW